MMKKILALVLTFMMLLVVFAGCEKTPASENKTSETSSKASVKPETDNIKGKHVTLITSERTYAGQKEAWLAAAEGFKEETGATLEFIFKGKWTDLIQTLQAAKVSGVNYDMASLGSGNLHQAIAPGGLVLDITEIVKPLRDRFLEGTVEQHTIGGRVYGLPFGSLSTTGLFYNKTMFDELGLSISNGYTYEDFLKIGQKIKAEKNITPIIQQGAAWWWWPAWFFFTYAQTSGNNSVAEIEAILSGERSFNEDDVVQAFELIQRFLTDGLIDTTSLETDNDGMAAIFMQQKAAMFFGAATEYVKVQEADFEIGFVSYPVVVNGAIPQSSGGADEGINVLSLYNPDNLDAIAAVLEYFTRPEVNAKIVEPLKAFGYPVKGVPGASTEISDAAYELYVGNTITYLDWYWSAAHNDAMVAAIQGLVTNKMDPKAAAEHMKAAYDATVKEGYKYKWWEDWTQDQWKQVTLVYIPKINVK